MLPLRIPCLRIFRSRPALLALFATLLAAAFDPPSVQAQSLSLTADATSLPVRQTLHLTASAGTGATGSVTFFDGAARLASVPLSATSTAVYASAILVSGNHSFSAAYSGDPLHTATRSQPVSVRVNTILPPAFKVAVNHPVTFNSQPLVAYALGLPPEATGSVTFYDNDTPVGSAAIVRTSGLASLSLGDDIPAGATLASPALAFPALLAAEHGLTFSSNAAPNQAACDILLHQLVETPVDFTQAGGPLTTLLTGLADTAQPASEPVFKLCHQAALAWLAIPREFKVLPGDPDALALTGPWAISDSLSTLYNNSGFGSAQFSITSTGAPVYVWYLLDQDYGGLFTVTVDGVPNPTIYNAKPPAGTNTAGGLGFALLRLPLPAGPHVLQFTLQSGSLAILAVVTPPSAADGSLHPTVLVADLPSQNQAEPRDPASVTAPFSADIEANVAQLAADGLDLRLVPTRSFMTGTPDAMSDAIHPNALGHTQLAAAFDSILPAVPPAGITMFQPNSPSATGLLTIPGTRLLTAIYSGDSIYSSAISAPLHITVQDGTTRTVLTTPSASVAYRTIFPLTASVTPVPSGGSVTFFANGVVITTVPLLAGIATTTTSLDTGAYALTATFTPYDGRAESTSTPVTLNVARQDPALSLTAQQQGQPGSQPATQTSNQPSAPAAVLTAYVTPLDASGTVSFSDAQSGLLGTAPVIDGAAFLPVQNLTTGTHLYTAAYSGDSVYTPIASAPASLAAAPLATSLVLVPHTSTAGSAATVHVDVLAAAVPLLPFTPARFAPALNAGTAFMGDSITQWWPLPINDRGIAGQTTTQMVGRFESDVLNQGFDRVVILGGTNDTLLGLDPANTLTNLTTMATQAISGGLRPILATIPPIFSSRGQLSPQVFSLNAGIRALARQNGWLLLDYYAALVQHPEFFPDDIHPNPAGYAVMETVLAQTLFVPSGSVTLSDGTSARLSPTGIANLTTLPMPGGPHLYTVSFAGDASFAPASAPFQTNLAQTASATTLSVRPIDGYSGNAAAFSAAVASPVALAATGNITFFDNGRIAGSAPLTSRQSATYTASNLAPGAHAFTATYAGDPSFTTSTSPAIVLTSPFSNTSLALSAAAPTAIAGTPVTLTANLTPASAAGTVTFLDSNAILAQLPLAAGQAAFTTSSLALGPHTLTALYSGDANDSIATSPVLAITINPSPTILTLAALPAAQTVGTATRLTASITPAAAAGQVAFLDRYTAPNETQATIQTLGQASLSGGSASFTLASLRVGTHVLSAAYAGDPADLPSASAPVSAGVTPLISTISLSTPQSTLTHATPATFAVIVSPATATGTVSLRDSAGATLAQAPLANAIATFSIPNLSIGLHSFTAAYAGDLNDSAATSLPVALTITPAPTTLTLAPVPAQIAAGSTVTLTASISPATATGQLTFRDAHAGTLGQASLAGGIATLTLPSLTVASYSFTATYAGDPQDAPSLSNAVTTQIALTPTTTLLDPLPPQLASGTALTLRASTSPNPTSGSLTFFDGSNPLGTGLLVNGAATLQIPALPVGPHSLHATFAGDTLLAPSSSPAATVLVASSTTSTTLTLAQLTLTDGDPITVNVQVAGSAASAPTGIITIRSGAGILASGSLGHAQGSIAYATLTLSSALLGPGSSPITAFYPGDTTNAASDSSATPTSVTIVRAAVALTLLPATTILPVQTPLAVSATLTGPTPAQVPTGTVTFLLNGAPLVTVPVDSAGTAVATLPGQLVGSYALTAAYMPTGIFAPAGTPAQTLTYTPPVSVIFPTDTLTMTPDSHANANLLITPLSGFTGAIAAQCSTSVPFVTCTVDAPSALAGPTAAVVHLAVANSTASATPRSLIPLSPAPFTLAALLLLPLARRRNRCRLALLLLALAALSSSLTGCGSKNNFNTIPNGYQLVTVSVTANQTTSQAQLNIQISN